MNARWLAETINEVVADCGGEAYIDILLNNGQAYELVVGRKAVNQDAHILQAYSILEDERNYTIDTDQIAAYSFDGRESKHPNKF